MFHKYGFTIQYTIVTVPEATGTVINCFQDHKSYPTFQRSGSEETSHMGNFFEVFAFIVMLATPCSLAPRNDIIGDTEL
jgi:hypothetical protein